jgi:hypothetical protein
MPTLFWINSSDLALRLVPLIGLICSVMYFLGIGPVWLCWLICWMCWLSMDQCTTAGNEYPWYVCYGIRSSLHLHHH